MPTGLPQPHEPPLGPPYGDGTPYGYGQPYGNSTYTGWDCGTYGAYAGGGFSSGWGTAYAGVIGRPVATDPKKRYIAANPGMAYSPDAGFVLSADWEATLGQSGSVAYRRMMLDPQVRSSYSYFKWSVLGNGPKISPAIEPAPGAVLTPEESAEFDLARELAEFCTRQHERLPDVLATLGQILDAAAYKSMLAEIVTEMPDSGPDAGLECLASLSPRPPRAWAYVVDAFGETIGYMGWTASGPVVLEPDHCLVFAWEPTAGDPRGTSILEPAYSAWNEKVSLVPERFRHLVQFGSPSVDYELPAEAQDQPRVDARGNVRYDLPPVSAVQQGFEQISAFRGGGLICRANGGKLQILGAANDGGAFTAAKVDCNREIATGILLSPRSTMEAEHGSKADNEGGQDAAGSLIRHAQARLAASYRGVFRYLIRRNKGEAVAARLTPLVSFAVEHKDTDATMAAQAQAGWQADPSAYPAMDVRAGLPPRPMPEPGEEEEPQPGEPDGKPGKPDDKAPSAKFSGEDDAHHMLMDAAAAMGLVESYRSGTATAKQRTDLCHAVSLIAGRRMRDLGAELLSDLEPHDKAEFAHRIVADRVKSFVAGMLRAIRTGALAATLALVGPGEIGDEGRAAMAAEVADQEKYLGGFEADLIAGKQKPDGTLPARAEMYGAASYEVGQNVARQMAAALGAKYERRNLASFDSACPTCRAEAAKGWQPSGTLRPLGDSVCHSNCRCTFSYSDDDGVIDLPSLVPPAGSPKGSRMVRTPAKDTRLFVPPIRIGAKNAVVTVDVARFDQALDELRVGPSGENAIPGRLEEFRRFYAEGDPIEMGRANLAPDGSVSFEDGRHRFAVLRDMGFKRLPVVVPADEAEGFAERFGG